MVEDFPWIFVGFVVVGLAVVVGLVVFLIRRRFQNKETQVSDQINQPSDGQQVLAARAGKQTLVAQPRLSVEEERRAFVKMTVPFNEVETFSKIRGRRLTSVELAMVTQKIRQSLRNDYFDFEPTYHQILGAMFDVCLLFHRTRTVHPLGQIVVLREADRQLRQELGLDPKVELSTEQCKQLEGKFSLLVQQAQAKKDVIQARQIAKSGHVPLPANQGPIARKTVEELIQWEAEFQARKALKLGKDDPIPPDELERQIQDAWKVWRGKHDIPEPEGGDKSSG